jgi:hypothetical protein
MENPMSIEFQGHAQLHQLGENATHPIARFSGRLAVRPIKNRLAADGLLFVAGSSHAPHRALPDNPKTAHSNASNCGF